MKVAGYARVVPGSSADALAHQQAVIERFVHEKGYELVGHFAEIASADVPLGPGRQELARALESLPPQSGLVVVRLNRLSGQKRLLERIFQACQSRQIEIIAVAGPSDPRGVASSFEVTAMPGQPGAGDD